MAAWREVDRAVSSRLATSNLVVVHDPELVVLAARWRRRCPVVWDVHEDFAASVGDREWIPAPARRPMAALVQFVQRWAARRLHVTIAEDSYAASFPGAPVVPNSTWMPGSEVGPGHDATLVPEGAYLVYVGRVSRARGLDEMIEIGRLLRDGMRMIVIGSPDVDVADSVRRAHADGLIDARGPLPNPEALAIARGAVAGLSLLHDLPNYRHSRPTKITEYLAHGVPVITTPLPLAVEMATASGAGIVIDHGDIDTVAARVADAARALLADPQRRRTMAEAGRRYVSEHHSWDVDGQRFVALLEGWAR
jgi:glycosyltransferase involved in cell wall biosynthesis